MLKINNIKERGFTIVELLIVIVVIAILAALVLNTFAGVQQKARDSDRQNDLATVQKHLETYYTDNGGYPAESDLATAAWVTKNMQGLAPEAFLPPQVDSNALQSTTAGDKDQYGYVTDPTSCVSPTATDGSKNTGTFCTKYSLSWYSEAKKATQTINSLSGQ